MHSDQDRDFILDGVYNGFKLFPLDSPLKKAEMDNYHSAVAPEFRKNAESKVRKEFLKGNYKIVKFKPTIVSALGSVPKAGSPNDVRLIHDCSMPPLRGLNNYIEIEHQKFQTIEDATSKIKRFDWMAKIDLKSAYRSVPIHPGNYDGTGLKWKFPGDRHFSYLVDTRLPFGASSSPGIFHRITQSIRRIMGRMGYSNVVVYLDDFLIIARSKEECEKAYQALMSLLIELGFSINYNKVVPPCQRLVFLGIEIDSVSLSCSLPLGKLNDLKIVVNNFLSLSSASKKQLQTLAGKLNWACRVVYGGRTFLRRLLDLMNTLPLQSSKCKLTLDTKRDLLWWSQFLEVFNGKCAFHKPQAVIDVQTDACNTAVGGFFRGWWFYVNFFLDFPRLSQLHINSKETLAIVFAAMAWGPKWANHHVVVYSDNKTVVSNINKGRAKSQDQELMYYIRLLFWISAVYNFRVSAQYVVGTENRLADAVSRLHEPGMIPTFIQETASLDPSHLLSLQEKGTLSYSSKYFLFSAGNS